MARAGSIALLVLAFIGLYMLVSGNGGHRYTLVFENAGQLVKDNQVLIGGSPVGSIKNLDLTEDGLARIDVEMEQELHEGTTAVIRATSLAGIANRYISISPGPNSSPELPDGGVIGPDDTTSPVDLDQLLNTFTPKVRGGLRDFIRGQAAIFEDRAQDARQTYKYFGPALAQTNEWLEALNGDQRMFSRFLTSSADLMTTFAERRDDLSQSVSNARQAFSAVAARNAELDQTLEHLAPAFRQSNTTFLNLRAALDDLDPLVDTAKPATKDLGPFLKRLRPVLGKARPVFDDLGQVVAKRGKNNDLAELTGLLPKVQQSADTNFARASQAIADFQPTLDFARPYSVDMVQSLVKLGQVMAPYDAYGHYARAGLAGLNFFNRDGGGLLEALAPNQQYAPYGATRIQRRCPGAATQSAQDASSPFVAPAWPESGLAAGDCDVSEVLPGP